MSTSTADEQLDAEVIDLEPTMHIDGRALGEQGRVVRVRARCRDGRSARRARPALAGEIGPLVAHQAGRGFALACRRVRHPVGLALCSSGPSTCRSPGCSARAVSFCRRSSPALLLSPIDFRRAGLRRPRVRALRRLTAICRHCAVHHQSLAHAARRLPGDGRVRRRTA